jgi:hypothetical protein
MSLHFIPFSKESGTTARKFNPPSHPKNLAISDMATLLLPGTTCQQIVGYPPGSPVCGGPIGTSRP